MGSTSNLFCKEGEMNKRKTVNWVTGQPEKTEQEIGNLGTDACNFQVRDLIQVRNFRFWLHANHQLTTRFMGRRRSLDTSDTNLPGSTLYMVANWE